MTSNLRKVLKSRMTSTVKQREYVIEGLAGRACANY
jgi:hypothetical protein